MNGKFNRIHIITYTAALLICLAVILRMMGPYLLGLFFGGMLAMLTYPVYLWLISKKFRRAAAAAAVTVLILVLFFGPLVLFSITAIKQGINFIQNLAGLKDFTPESISGSLNRWQAVQSAICSSGQYGSHLKDGIRLAVEYAGSVVIKLGKNIPMFILQSVISVISCFFFLLDGERFLKWLLGLNVLDKEVQNKLVESFHGTAISAILSGLAAAACESLLMLAAFLAMSLPGAFLAAGSVFMAAWLPMVGASPVWLAAMVYLYMQGLIAKMILLFLIGCVAGITDNLLRALILKGRAALHPWIALLAVFGGMDMFGILGVFIGPLLIGMLLSLLTTWPLVGARLGIVYEDGPQP